MIIGILSVIRTAQRVQASGLPLPVQANGLPWHPLTMLLVDIASYRPSYLHTAADAADMTARDLDRQVGMYDPENGRVWWGAYPCDVPGGETLSVRYVVARGVCVLSALPELGGAS